MCLRLVSPKAKSETGFLYSNLLRTSWVTLVRRLEKQNRTGEKVKQRGSAESSLGPEPTERRVAWM